MRFNRDNRCFDAYIVPCEQNDFHALLSSEEILCELRSRFVGTIFYTDTIKLIFKVSTFKQQTVRSCSLLLYLYESCMLETQKSEFGFLMMIAL